MNQRNRKILYLNFSDNNNSINGVYIKGLRENGVVVVDFFSHRGWLAKYYDVTRFFWRHKKEADIVMIGGFTSQGLVPWIKLISGKKVVFNALCSLYERLIVSRNLAPRFSLKSLYYWLLDFFSVHAADLILLESNNQIEYMCKLLFLSPKKCLRAWIGVDGKDFFYQTDLPKFERFTVVFRGRFLPESGVEYAVKAAKKLENEKIDFLILGFGPEEEKIKNLIEDLKPKNLKLETAFLPIDTVRQIMQRSHLSLGQLSDHVRLDRTIPHKVFESAALKLPIMTARNSAIFELFKEGETCLACEPANAEDLAKEIIWAKDHPAEIKKIADNAYQLFCEKLTAEKLAGELLIKLDPFFSQ